MLETSRKLALQLWNDFSADDCPSMAAALAYYTIFSLPSLLLIAIYIAGLVYGAAAASGAIQARLSREIGPQAAAEIQTMVASAGRSHAAGLLATALGIVGLVFSATTVMLQLQKCLNRAWKVSVTGSGVKYTIQKYMTSGLLLIGAGILALLSLAASSVLAAFSQMLPFAGAVFLAENFISVAVFSVVFGIMLKVLPDVRLGWTDSWLGGTFIAVLFVIGKFLIGLYLGHGGKSGMYGAAGSLALIMLWTYYSALVFLLGVEFTQLWVRTHGRTITAKSGAVLLHEQPAAS
jgi:membrane protein